MTERIYDDDEVARILGAATAVEREAGGQGGSPTDPPGADSSAPPTAAPMASRGLTLGELQEIGAEAGIDPHRITTAAHALDRPAPLALTETGFGGRPRRLAREIPLPAPLEGENWDRLVVLLRSHFGGPGEVTTEGSLRSWTHGEVHAHQEPDPAGEGWRLRVETKPSEIQETLDLFGLLLLTGVILVLVGIFTDAAMAVAYLGALLLASGGMGGGWILGRTLPKWADEQDAALLALADQVTRLAARASG